MAYRLEIIGRARRDELVGACKGLGMFALNADINGICVQLRTCKREYAEMWADNFYAMSDSVRPHAVICCLGDSGIDPHVEYEIETRTVFLFDFDYYGWIKSIALGVAGNILEDCFSTYSVHGAALSVDGFGVSLIAPPKTGKTTQSWGLLRERNVQLITDDWYFVSFGDGRPRAAGSEKNCYIDADIGDVWEEYRPLVREVRFDDKGRGIANVRWVAGESSVIRGTGMGCVFLLKRDYGDSETLTILDPVSALRYLEENDFCNPHQLLRDEYRVGRRKEFFRRYLSECETFLVNTIGTPEETQSVLKKTIRERCGK